MIKVLLIGTVLVLVEVLIILRKQRKKIWQKIDVIYNQIYMLMIEKFYKSQYEKKLLKEELKDYLQNIIFTSNLRKKQEYLNKLKLFIKQYIGLKINGLLNELDLGNHYISSLSNISLFIILSIIVLLSTLFII